MPASFQIGRQGGGTTMRPLSTSDPMAVPWRRACSSGVLLQPQTLIPGGEFGSCIQKKVVLEVGHSFPEVMPILEGKRRLVTDLPTTYMIKCYKQDMTCLLARCCLEPFLKNKALC